MTNPTVPNVLEDRCTLATRAMAKKLYMAYCENADNKNFQGNPCPVWEDLPMLIRSNWCASVIAAMPQLNHA